ncbi:TonB-dependent siderophore receptor [Undibacterium cyanobacteriorum]|uniref:TonB-dependent siderophore receptor n=1 Tax=Undibacterium cyanobacteriorum TaxID=3073561 RepID=A0ABY9RGD5_9BURK|nr:TonB-dependent siderophore receptor [Undibacterium sp. 20NA77.5]WMW79181.1 TonB-dependent siderophore receptor [Undibacterium sp. 20NA77.5]
MTTTSFKPKLLALSLSAAFSTTTLPSHAQDSSKTQSLQEIVVSGTRTTKVESSKVGGFLENSLQDTPLSINAFSSAQLQDLRIRQTTDASKFDASINDAYNAVGYAEQFSIRGFALDNSSSYRKDGFAIPGDASIPLENKERIEILKGISGFQAGFTTPGGMINYVTKRPSNNDLRSITLEASERGTLYGAVDLGGKTSNKQFGYRLNAANERLRSYIKGADGERQFASIALDWKPSAQSLLQFDADYQHKSQLSAPGFQLFNGTALPVGIKADMMLNNQKWAKPVDTRNQNIGARFEYQLNQDWNFSLASNYHEFKRDDFTAFPYGCSAQELYPGYCANGDYDVYDYQSVGELKKLQGNLALLTGKFELAGTHHQLAAGFNNSERRDYYGDYAYEHAGASNVFHPVAVPPSANKTGPVSLRRTDKENSLFVQDIIALDKQFDLHLGLRHLQVKRQQLGSPDFDQDYTLPNAALVFKASPSVSNYLSISRGLEHGGVAPIGTTNANKMLDAGRSKQIEIGTKAIIANDISLNAALFRISKPLEYTNSANTYVSAGEAEHQGVEFSAQGKINSDWTLGASATAIDARQRGTNDPSIEDKRISNVPNFKSSVYADYAPVALAGVHVNGSWQYAASKAFSPDNKISVPGYHVFNFGARYALSQNGITTTLRFDINNAFNKFYWRDVTQSLGGYLFPGAPRTFKLSAQIDF